MYCDFTFENCSRNRNVQRVGLFWALPVEDSEAVPLIWAEILRCPHRWTHPIRIPWLTTCRFTKIGGSMSPEIDFREVAEFQGIHLVTRTTGAGEVLRLTLPEEGHPYRRVQLLRKGRPMLSQVLPPTGQVSIVVPERLMVSSDACSDLGSEVAPDDVSPGAETFDLNDVAALRVAMSGGEPGPECRPLAFSTTEIARW